LATATAKNLQENRDASLKALTEFWRAHKKEYVEARSKEIEFGKKAYKIEKIIKGRAKDADIVVDGVTPEGDLMVVIDRHVRIIE
jgi:hypothetical protein